MRLHHRKRFSYIIMKKVRQQFQTKWNTIRRFYDWNKIAIYFCSTADGKRKSIYCILKNLVGFLSGVSIESESERMLSVFFRFFCPFGCSQNETKTTIQVSNVEHLTLLALFYEILSIAYTKDRVWSHHEQNRTSSCKTIKVKRIARGS